MTIEDLRAAKASLDGIRDAEVRALVAAAATVDALIIPSELVTRPTIMLPTAMYERMRDLFPIMKTEPLR